MCTNLKGNCRMKILINIHIFISPKYQQEKHKIKQTKWHTHQCFFVNEDGDENFRGRSYFNFRWRDENCDDNSDNFVNITKTAMKNSVFSLTRWWQRRKLSKRRKPFRRKFEICKHLSRPYSISKEYRGIESKVWMVIVSLWVTLVE